MPKAAADRHDVFISYAREDQVHAEQVAAAFTARGWSVWWDRSSLLPGEPVNVAIQRALDASQCVVALWSPSSVESHWVIDEANEGRGRGVLVPARLADVRIPLGFRQLETQDLSEWTSSHAEDGLDRLIRAVDRIVPRGTPAKRDVLFDSRFRLEEHLPFSEGAEFEHWRATDTLGAQQVIVKRPVEGRRLDEIQQARFVREASIRLQTSHRHVWPVTAVRIARDAVPYMVMPHTNGQLLSDIEVAEGPATAEGAITIAVQVCAGLQHLHDFGIVHRNLKPESVLVARGPSGEREAMIAECSFARVYPRAGPALTNPGIILGTPEFMSPEQVRGKVLDERSDLFALGIMIYEMLTGHLPFVGRTAQELMIARLRGGALSLEQYRSDLDRELAGALAQSLQADPERRFRTATAFASALLSVTGKTLPDGWPYHQPVAV